MSMAEPFMPAHEPREPADPTDIALDSDVDVFIEAEVNDPDAEAAAERQRARVQDISYRTPLVGERITPEALAQDLDGTPPR